jgi:hypothetical protein
MVAERSVNQFHDEIADRRRHVGRQETAVPAKPPPRPLIFIPSPPLVPDQCPPSGRDRRG